MPRGPCVPADIRAKGGCAVTGRRLCFAAALVFSSAGYGAVVPAASGAQQAATAELPSVSVTADPAQLAFSHPMRSVTVLDRKDIQQSPAKNLNEMLATVNGVTVHRRGSPGVQSDISIRGSNFKETQILIDGVPAQNPQAAHLNSNLAIPLSAVQRIEVVKGPGAIQYGGTGTGGIINIVTRRAGHPQVGAEVAGGSHATRRVDANIGTGNRRFSSLLSARVSHSDSEKSSHPTDADIAQALYTGDAALGALHLKLGLAAARKKFGAWGFYSDVAPDAREKTHSRMAWLNADLPLGKWALHGRGYWIRQKDSFLTFIGDDSFGNRHKTDVSGFDADVKRRDEWGITVAGGKLRYENIHSNALGRHHRNKTALWLYRRQRLTDRLSAELGVNRVDYQDDKAYWLPSVALAWQFNDSWRTYASWARSARVPTYTELYLATPANQGNPELGVEKSEYYEIGLNGYFHHQQLKMAVYRRQTSDFIDFTRQPGQSAFQAENLHGFHTTGGDIDWHWYPGWRWLDEIQLGYSRMHTHIGGGAAKNSTHIPRQTIRAGLRVPLKYHFYLAVDARRPSYRGQSAVTLIGARLKWRYEKVNAYLEVHNLLDKKIVEAGFAPIPGRWVTAGAGFQF